MITHLSIHGLAIIDSLHIDFHPGFNVITGETGAGKSILIRAMHFLTGAKVSTEAIRKGHEAAAVTGEFQVAADHPAVGVLLELGIHTEKGSSVPIILRRQLQAKGRSHAWINDTPVSLPALRQVGTLLVDVFAQHENQRLLNPVEHVHYIDAFIAQADVREKVRALGRACMEDVEALRERLQALAQSRLQSDYLGFRHAELDAFRPCAKDFAETQAYCQTAERFQKHREPLVRALEVLEGADSSGAAAQCAREAARMLGTTAAPELRDRLLAAAAELEDIGFEMGRSLSEMDFDGERLSEAQERLYGYQDLFRKHAVTGIEPLLAQAQRLADQLDFLASANQQLKLNLKALGERARELKKAAEALSIARHQAAQTIKAEVERELAELQMPGSVFQAEFQPLQRAIAEPDWTGCDPGLQAEWDKTAAVLRATAETGAEKAQFFLSANPGEPPMPLAKVASGGELSRIMLALKKALAADAQTCVLVFDEIDTGISGRVADIVGRKMRELATEFQVICISHLPQVAVYADAHWLVAKAGRADRTESSIIPLSKEESAREIARLLSGSEVSSSSLANAKSLIATAATKVPRKPRRTAFASEAKQPH